jgi:AraC family transcriptional regulator, transcriptional activator of pobA
MLIFKSVSQLMGYLNQPAPLYPLISLVDYKDTQITTFEKGVKVCLDFYKISFKTSFSGKVKYGQGYYDFEEGGLAFLKPKQIVTSSDDDHSYEGYSLFFHPDFIRNYPLGDSIKKYGFFSYSVSEALFLSIKEKNIINNLFVMIANELENNIDHFSQDILITQIEQLLSYSNRFYSRQFITRRVVNNDMIILLDELLDEYFEGEKGLNNGLPSVQYISTQLKLSARYLSDMLKMLTGLNTQQYIQSKVIDKSKDLLSSTSLSVSEVAYLLGFEHPQSFNKLFKSRTSVTPSEYRQSFN